MFWGCLEIILNSAIVYNIKKVFNSRYIWFKSENIIRLSFREPSNVASGLLTHKCQNNRHNYLVGLLLQRWLYTSRQSQIMMTTMMMMMGREIGEEKVHGANLRGFPSLVLSVRGRWRSYPCRPRSHAATSRTPETPLQSTSVTTLVTITITITVTPVTTITITTIITIPLLMHLKADLNIISWIYISQCPFSQLTLS